MKIITQSINSFKQHIGQYEYRSTQRERIDVCIYYKISSQI